MSASIMASNENRFGFHPQSVFEFAEKAAAVTSMAGDSPHLLHFEHDYVAIAVEPDLLNKLHVARFLALTPQTLARARPVYRPAGTHRLRERFAVHPRRHQQPAGADLLCNGRDQALRIENHFVKPELAHSLTSMLCCAIKRFACCTVNSP
jgi:hypothetical protein